MRHDFKSPPLVKTIICLGMALSFLIVLAPQVAVFARGMRTLLPLLLAIPSAALLLEPGAFARTLSNMRVVAALVFLFVIQGGIRLLFSPEVGVFELARNYIISPCLLLEFWFFVTFAGELGSGELKLLQNSVLIGSSIAIILGIPTLLGEVGIARLAMGVDTQDPLLANSLMLHGVGNFGFYSGIAVTIAIRLQIVRYWKGWARLVGFGLLAGVGYAVMISTFVMASVLAILGSLLALPGLIRHRMPRLIIGFVATGTILAAPIFLEYYARKSPQVEFVYAKSVRLFEEVRAHGLSGDETGRGERVETSIPVILDGNWAVGYIPGVTPIVIGGHSSIIDSLVLFGLGGVGIWGAIVYILYRKTVGSHSTASSRWPVRLTWGLYLASGMLNPTWYTPGILAGVMLFGLNAHNSHNYQGLKVPPKVDYVRRRQLQKSLFFQAGLIR